MVVSGQPLWWWYCHYSYFTVRVIPFDGAGIIAVVFTRQQHWDSKSGLSNYRATTPSSYHILSPYSLPKMKLRICNLSASYHSTYSAYEGKTIKPTVSHTRDHILASLGLEKGHLWQILFLPCPGSYAATQQLSALGPFQCRGSQWGLHFGMARGAFITSQASHSQRF